jgi:hypothetical protein
MLDVLARPAASGLRCLSAIDFLPFGRAWIPATLESPPGSFLRRSDYDFRTSSGSLAIFVAILRASSLIERQFPCFGTYLSTDGTGNQDKVQHASDRGGWGTEIVGKVKAWAKALTGPTSLPGKYPQLMNPPGSETGPGQLVTWGKSTVCSVDAFGFKFQWTTNSSKHIPFDWTGP